MLIDMTSYAIVDSYHLNHISTAIGSTCRTFGHCSCEFWGELDPMLPLAPGVPRPQTTRLALGNIDVWAGRVLAKIA